MNRKDKNYKEYLRIQRRKKEIWKVKSNAGFEKLDEPYQKGYKAHWVLRPDISRRDDAEYLQVLLDNFMIEVKSERGDFIEWDWRHRGYTEVKPRLKAVPEHEWINFYPWVQKWFRYNPTLDRKYWRFGPHYGSTVRYYECVIPEYFLEMKIEKDWVTHKKVGDEVLEQELAELDYLEDKVTNHRGWMKMGDKSAKGWKQMKNRNHRRNERMSIQKHIHSQDWDEITFPIRKKDILWDLW